MMQTQRGFSSVMLIAIIVVLAGMTSFALNFLSASQGGVNADLLALRAEEAARAGVEWQRFRLNGAAPSCVAATSLAIPFSTGNFPVTVTCVRSSPAANYTDTGGTYRSYQIVATACWPANAGGTCGVVAASQQPDYVERSVYAQAVCNVATGVCTWPR